MAKRNDVPPPAFPALTGEAVIHYASHDGRAVIGRGKTLFETRWSGSGADTIQVLNDPPGIRGVAIAHDARSASEVTVSMAANLDFTSRIRRPREGEVVVFENTAGHFLAAQIVDVLAASHGDPEDRLVLRYTVVSDDQSSPAVEVARLAAEVGAELARLRPSKTEAAAPAYGGIGHNNPPEPTPLSVIECEQAIKAARQIGQEATSPEPNRSAAQQAAGVLRAAAAKVLNWVARKCDLAAEEIAKMAGKATVPAVMGWWVGAAEKINELLGALATWLS